MTLANGLNSNIATASLLAQRIVGPTGAFSIGGFAVAGVNAGQPLVIINTTSQVMTLVHEDASSTAANRIDTQSGLPVILAPRKGSATFTYDAVSSRWVLQNSGYRFDRVVDVRDFGADPTGVTDSTSAIQSAINFAILTHSTVYAVGTYLLSAANASTHALTVPLNVPGTWSFRMEGEGWGDGSVAAGGNRTTFVAATTMKSLLNIVATDCCVRGIKLDGANKATYGLYCQGVSVSHFNVFARGCLVDGIHMAVNYDGSGGSSNGSHCINDQCEFHRCWASQNGQIRCTASLVAEYGTFGSLPPATITGTAATTANSNLVAFSGAPNLTTLGIRPGDVLRLGPTPLSSATKFWQVASVTSNTITLGGTGSFQPTSSVSGLDYAICVGDGYHEEESGDNNNSLMNGGIWQGNACYGMMFAGLYGPHVMGAPLLSANGGACIGIGFGGGTCTPIATKIDKAYFESSYPNIIIGGARSIQIHEPLLSGNAFGDILVDPIVVTGHWSGLNPITSTVGVFPLGVYFNSLNQMSATKGFNFTADQAFGFIEERPTVTSTGFQFDAIYSWVSFAVTGGPFVLTGTAIAAPPTLTQSQDLYLYNTGATSVTIPQAGTVKCKNGVSCVIAPKMVVAWAWSAATSTWNQVGDGAGDNTPGQVVSAATYTILDTDAQLYYNRAAGISVTLPPPVFGRRIGHKNIAGSGTVTLLPHAGETIENGSSLPITTLQSFDLRADGTNWWIC
jgi:hypothetical protein